MTPALVARLAAARRIGTLGRRRRVPIARPPTLIESDYAGRLVGLVDRLRHAARWVGYTARTDALRLDEHPGAKARRNADRMRAEADAVLNTTALEGVATEFGRRVANHQRGELARQTEAAFGADVVTVDAGIGDLIEGFVHENVSRIKTLTAETLGKLETILVSAAASGTRAEAIQQELEERFGIAERHARLVARDQVQKLNSRVTEARHTELGIQSYIWIHLPIAKQPRPVHVARHGKPFRYDNPPADGHAGWAICCHCLQQPFFDDIYAELDARGV